jgi:hypothetical protein
MSFGFKAVDGCVKSALLLNDLLGGIQYSFIGFKKNHSNEQKVQVLS